MPIKLNGSGSGSVALNAPANTSGGSDISFTLPTADGTSGQVLQTNGSGALSFASASSDNITEGNTSVEVVDTGSNGEVRLSTEGTRAATIDSSSRLLVGTSSAYTTFNYAGGDRSARFQVYGTGIDTGSMALIRTSEWPIFYFASGGTSNVSSGSVLGAHVYTGYHTSKYYTGAEIRCEVDGTPGAGDMPGRLLFSTTADSASSPTERLRITNGGEIASYSSVQDSLVGGSAGGSSTAYSLFTGVHSRTGTQSGGTVAYRIYNNGTTFSISDERHKKNIETARDGYLDDIQQLRVVKYNWKDQDDAEPKELGLIAQEVATVFPGLVQQANLSDPESELGVKSSVLTFMLIKALQEATTRIETLEAEVAALKGA